MWSTHRLHDLLSEIQERYIDTVCIFPLNVTLADLMEHGIWLKHGVNLAERGQFLIVAFHDYWDTGQNVPGPGYSRTLWLEMLSYGYKCGSPPPIYTLAWTSFWKTNGILNMDNIPANVKDYFTIFLDKKCRLEKGRRISLDMLHFSFIEFCIRDLEKSVDWVDRTITREKWITLGLALHHGASQKQVSASHIMVLNMKLISK